MFVKGGLIIGGAKSVEGWKGKKGSNRGEFD
jgi:hypothetical protein